MTPRRWLLLTLGVFALLLAGAGVTAFLKHPSVSPSSPSAPTKNPATQALSNQGLETRVLLAQAERARIEGSLFEAKKLYQEILQEHPESPEGPTVSQQLGLVNLKLLLSPTITPDSVTYVIQPGDTLSKIAKQNHSTVELLKAANHLSSDRIRPGERLKVTRASFSLIVDKSQNTLTLKNGEEVLKVYRCSTGQGGITPAGSFRITSRLIDPPWYSPDGVIPPGDSKNPLGSRWLGFDVPRYGIHGTTDPASIGKPVTKGCVRLANSDAEELFTLLPEGTSVNIVE